MTFLSSFTPKPFQTILSFRLGIHAVFFACNECEGRPMTMAKHHKSSPSDLYSKNMLIFKIDVAIGCVSHESQ